MGYMIEITDKKVGKLSEHIEKGLRHLGKAMQCVDEWMEKEGHGERDGYGNRYEYEPKHDIRYRDDEDDDDDYSNRYMMGERRMRRTRDSRGRYM